MKTTIFLITTIFFKISVSLAQTENAFAGAVTNRATDANGILVSF